MAGTHWIYIDVFSAVQLSERTDCGWIFAPQRRKSPSSLSGKTTFNTSMSVCSPSLSETTEFTMKFCTPKRSSPSSLNTVETHRRLFLQFISFETTVYRWIIAPQSRLQVNFWHHKRRNSPSSFSGRNTLNSHWYLSAVHFSLQRRMTGGFLQHTQNEVHRHLWVVRKHFS